MNAHKVAIVLATYNRASILPLALKSIMTQTYQKWELNIINDASSDQTQEVVDRYLDNNRVHYLKNFSNQGMIKSRNAGIDHCKAELIFIAEDDVILREGCLEILVKRFNDLKMIGIKNLFCVAPKILSVSSSAQPQNSSQNEGSWFKLNRLTGWIYTHYGDKFVETPILPSVGLYDSRLLRKIKHDENYGRNILRSDDDLHLTARKLGLRLFYEPRAMAMHLGYKSGGNRGVGLSAFFIRGFYIWKNQIRFTSKFFRIRSIYMNFIFSLVYLIYSCFSAPLVIRRARTVSGEGTQELTSVQSFRRMYKQIFKKLSPVILKDLE